MAGLRSVAGMILMLLALTAGAQDFAPIPPLRAHVTDTVGMLTPQQRQALENVLTEYKARTGSEIAILLIGKTEPEAIEQYGIRVAEAWTVGRKDIDDGVILIVARDNPPALRRLRIEAGRGVQGVLTDAQSRRILQDVIAPHFRQNDFYGGLAAAASAIISVLDKENFPAPQGAGKEQDAPAGWFGGLLPLIVFIFIIASMLSSRAHRMRRGMFGNRWGVGPGIILGGGGFDGFGRGGGGGGGFSGGGGTFDGGGASGDW